jgi:hypothetical protein
MAPPCHSSYVDPEPEFIQSRRQEPRAAYSQQRDPDSLRRDNRRRNVHFEDDSPSNYNHKGPLHLQTTSRMYISELSPSHHKTTTMASGYLDTSIIDVQLLEPVQAREERRTTQLYPSRGPHLNERAVNYDRKNPWTWPKLEKRHPETETAVKALTAAQLDSLFTFIADISLSDKKSEKDTTKDARKPTVSRQSAPRHAFEQKKTKNPYNFPRLSKDIQLGNGSNQLCKEHSDTRDTRDAVRSNNSFDMFKEAKFSHQSAEVKVPSQNDRAKNNKKQKQKLEEIKTMLKPLNECNAKGAPSLHYTGYATNAKVNGFPEGLQQLSPTARQKVSGWEMDPASVPHSSGSASPNHVSGINPGVPGDAGSGWNVDHPVVATNHGAGGSYQSNRVMTHSSQDPKNCDQTKISSKASQACDGQKTSYAEPKNLDETNTMSGRTKSSSSHLSPMQFAIPAGSILYANSDAAAGAERWETSKGLGVNIKLGRNTSRTSDSPTSRKYISNNGSGLDKSNWGGLEPVPEDAHLIQYCTSKTQEIPWGEATEKRDRSHSHESQKLLSRRVPGSKTSYQSPMVEEDPENWKGWKSTEREKASLDYSHKDDVGDWAGSVKSPSQSGHNFDEGHVGFDEPIKAWDSDQVPSDRSYGTGYNARKSSGMSTKQRSKSGESSQGGWSPAPARSRSHKGSSKESHKNEAEDGGWIESPSRSVIHEASLKGSKGSGWGW